MCVYKFACLFSDYNKNEWKEKKVLYQSVLQVEFPWIKKDEKDDQVKAHASSNNHVSKEKLLCGKTNQRVFVSASDKQVTLSSSSFILSPADQVTNEEIVLGCVDSNFFLRARTMMKRNFSECSLI